MIVCFWFFTTDPPDTPMNIRFSDITNTSFVVQWDEVDDADQYIVNWRGGSNVRESTTSRTSRTIAELTPNTTYYAIVIAINRCGQSPNSDIFMVTTKVTMLIRPSSSSVMTTTSTVLSSMVDRATTPTGNNILVS